MILVEKNLTANAGEMRETGSIPGSGRSPGEENSYPLQYSFLENSMDSGAWWATISGVAKSTHWKCVHFDLFSRSVVSDSATPWTVAHQAPPSTGFSRQEYWRGLPLPSSGDLPNPGIEPQSPALQTDTLPPEPPGKPQETICATQ